MASRLKKSYKFALRSSLFITLILLIFMLVLVFYGDQIEAYWLPIVLFSMIVFVVTFAVIQIRVEKFIYKRIKNI